MKGLWYGDRRDRVKWGTLVYLAQKHAICRVVQVSYLRHGEEPVLQTPDGEVPLPAMVWDHFSNLRNIKRLGKTVGLDILVLDQPFDPKDRRGYVADVVRHLAKVRTPKIVFLDPDTGMAPRTPKPEHATRADVTKIWDALSPEDLLVIYQHANRSSTWRGERSRAFSAACSGGSVQAIEGKGIASDVALLWCKKR